jgi:DNA sulfur modification protein DndD
MIFEEITIENLYSYRGRQTFNLAPPDAERNVVLISGRNGFGKTSFLNSVKLLFLGADFGSGDELRGEVQQGRKLNPQKYLLGWGDEWLGVFNRQARRDPNSRYAVSAVWREEQGRVAVTRCWTANGEESLEIQPDFPVDEETPLTGDAAKNFLESRLPARIVPFFFYDGEKVQEIAEANREGQLEQIERLLDLTLIDRLDEYLGRAVAHFRRAADPAAGFKEKEKAAELAGLQASYEHIQHDIGEKDGEIAEAKRHIARLDRQLKGTRELALQAEESRLQEKKRQLQDQLESEGQSLFNQLTPTAPLLLNPCLVQRAAEELEKLATSPHQKLNAQIEQILHSLPTDLFDRPTHPIPDITPGQREFLRDKLCGLIEHYRTEARHIQAGLFRLAPHRAEAVLAELTPHLYREEVRADLSRRLEQLRRRKRELLEVEAKLNDVGGLAPEEQRRYTESQEELNRWQRRVEELNQDKGRLQEQLDDKSNKIGKIEKELGELQRSKVQNRRYQASMDLGCTLRNLFTDFRRTQQERYQQEIEVALNRHIKVLITSHGMIDRIALGERFEMRYLAADGGTIGMGSLSAGMKQLVTQALLWALKDVAHRAAPVIIDTPLARIDREHQIQLISRYYPQAGRQVIVLPTDSELDAEKYALLKPHIGREYRLENTDGESTHAVEATMYPEVA